MNPTGEKVYDIFYDTTMGFVVMKWQGYSTPEQFKRGTEFMLQTLVQHKASKVLANIKDMDIIGLEDQKWLEHSFLPEALSKGFKAIAIVKPSSYFNAVAIESMLRRPVLSHLKMRVFDTEAEAVAWLSNVSC